MRKLWVKAWITLDGVFDAGTMDQWWQNTDSPERQQYIMDEYSRCDAYLLGRVTYEMLWPGWSKQTTGDGPGPILNRMHHYVVSTTLDTAPWKESTIISDNVVEELTKLKQQPGKEIVIDGSATLVQSLMDTDLIDEYRFLVQPFIMGSGRRFFPDGTPPTKLKLVETKLLSFGPQRADLPARQRMTAPSYDTIGTTYTVTRRTEPRIAAQVWAALGDARTVLNVGAGTGSYEPSERDVTAVEPSAVMRAQRRADAAPCVGATAERLPFEDQTFDAAMAFATIHHWQDPIAGLLEMQRVARRVVVFTHDTSDAGWLHRFWLTRDYMPEVASLVAGRPTLAELANAIGARTEPVLIPWDCTDGFFEAYWRRPEAYLDESVRRGISVWARVGPDVEQRVVRRLSDDLASGRWAERNSDLVDLEAAELGLRLLIA